MEDVSIGPFVPASLKTYIEIYFLIESSISVNNAKVIGVPVMACNVSHDCVAHASICSLFTNASM